METKIVEKPGMKIVGFTLHTTQKNGQNKKEIPPFFHKVYEEKKLESVPYKLDDNQLCIFKIQRNRPEFDYVMGTEVSTKDIIPEGMDFTYLPPSKYVAIKTVKRCPDDIIEVLDYIFKKWIPESEYIPTGEPPFIFYDNEFFDVFDKVGYAGNPMATVYVPIKPLFIKKLAGTLGLKKFSTEHSN